MLDRYTKIILTIIAVALVGLFVQNATSSANARDHDCGTFFKPCHVIVKKVESVVRITEARR